MMAIKIKAPLLLGVLLVLGSCYNKSHWTNDQMQGSLEEHCSTKLCYHSKDRLHGIDLEFIQTQEDLKIYLNVHSIPIPALNGNSKAASVKLQIEDELLQEQAYRLEGGQRLLLSANLAERLITALQAQKEVTLFLTGYRSVITPGDFPEKFHRFRHPLLWKNPFQLPL